MMGKSDKRTKARADTKQHLKQKLRDFEEKRRTQEQLAEEVIINLPPTAEDQEKKLVNAKGNKKFELMLTRRAKAYGNSCSVV